jgi:23S rRNA-/tRNA-specific pseudouridylate synthase
VEWAVGGRPHVLDVDMNHLGDDLVEDRRYGTEMPLDVAAYELDRRLRARGIATEPLSSLTPRPSASQ